jgi:hypothetical protein
MRLVLVAGSSGDTGSQADQQQQQRAGSRRAPQLPANPLQANASGLQVLPEEQQPNGNSNSARMQDESPSTSRGGSNSSSRSASSNGTAHGESAHQAGLGASLERLLSNAEAACSSTDAAVAVWEDGVTISSLLRLLAIAPAKHAADRQQLLRGSWQQRVLSTAGQLLVFGDGQQQAAALQAAMIAVADAAVEADPPVWEAASAVVNSFKAAEAGAGFNGFTAAFMRTSYCLEHKRFLHDAKIC